MTLEKYKEYLRRKAVLYIHWYNLKKHPELLDYIALEKSLKEYAAIWNDLFTGQSNYFYERVCKDYDRYKQKRNISNA